MQTDRQSLVSGPDGFYTFLCSTVSFPQGTPCLAASPLIPLPVILSLSDLPFIFSSLVYNMVQRAASNQLELELELEMITNRVGGAGAGDDHKQMPRSLNYMKPTASSDAKRKKPQVTTVHFVTPGNPKHIIGAKPSSFSPRRPSINKAIRATCSSTLKSSKFPKNLGLHSGGTEAQGTSVMRVCPHSYCSLNCHRHESLPPLQSFISARRKLLNTQKGVKIKGLPVFKMKGSIKYEDELVDDLFLEISAKVEEFRDLKLQSIGERNTQNELIHIDKYYSDIHLGDDLDQKSDLSVEEMYSIISLLEYVEFDRSTKAGEANQLSLVPEGREVTGKPTLKATGSILGEDPDGTISLASSEKETITDEPAFGPSSNLCVMVEAEQFIEKLEETFEALQHAKLETEQNLDVESLVNAVLRYGSEEAYLDDDVVTEKSSINHDEHIDKSWLESTTKQREEGSDVERNVQSYTKQESHEIDEDPKTADDNNYDSDGVYILSSYPSSEDKAMNTATTKTKQPLDEAADVPRAKMRITRKKISEETEQMKEFNPQPPQFLEIEPEPAAEKVDLRHQTMNDGKNPEEWMIDSALQRIISKLKPARKKKVDQLVQAFETLMPPRLREEPLFHSTSNVAHARIIQPCS